MAELAELIKIAAVNAIGASKPTEPIIGTVSSTNPMTISLDSKVLLYDKNLIFMKGLALKAGDKVLIIRASGGQKFYVIGEVED